MHCVVAIETLECVDRTILLPSRRYGEKRKGSESAKELSGVALLSATLNQCRKPNQQLLIPITVWIGMEQAFIGADFTQVCGRIRNASTIDSHLVLAPIKRRTCRAHSASTASAT